MNSNNNINSPNNLNSNCSNENDQIVQNEFVYSYKNNNNLLSSKTPSNEELNSKNNINNPQKMIEQLNSNSINEYINSLLMKIKTLDEENVELKKNFVQVSELREKEMINYNYKINILKSNIEILEQDKQKHINQNIIEKENLENQIQILTQENNMLNKRIKEIIEQNEMLEKQIFDINVANFGKNKKSLKIGGDKNLKEIKSNNKSQKGNNFSNNNIKQKNTNNFNYKIKNKTNNNKAIKNNIMPKVGQSINNNLYSNYSSEINKLEYNNIFNIHTNYNKNSLFSSQNKSNFLENTTFNSNNKSNQILNSKKKSNDVYVPQKYFKYEKKNENKEEKTQQNKDKLDLELLNLSNKYSINLNKSIENLENNFKNMSIEIKNNEAIGNNKKENNEENNNMK